MDEDMEGDLAVRLSSSNTKKTCSFFFNDRKDRNMEDAEKAVVSTTKDIWDAIKTRHMRADCVRKLCLQILNTEIVAGIELPHEIISDLDSGDGGQVTELQLKQMVDDLRKKDLLTNCTTIFLEEESKVAKAVSVTTTQANDDVVIGSSENNQISKSKRIAEKEESVNGLVNDDDAKEEKEDEEALKLYIHACKYWSQGKRATVARLKSRFSVSGLILAAKSCGEDVLVIEYHCSKRDYSAGA